MRPTNPTERLRGELKRLRCDLPTLGHEFIQLCETKDPDLGKLENLARRMSLAAGRISTFAHLLAQEQAQGTQPCTPPGSRGAAPRSRGPGGRMTWRA